MEEAAITNEKPPSKTTHQCVKELGTPPDPDTSASPPSQQAGPSYYILSQILN